MKCFPKRVSIRHFDAKIVYGSGVLTSEDTLKVLQKFISLPSAAGRVDILFFVFIGELDL